MTGIPEAAHVASGARPHTLRRVRRGLVPYLFIAPGLVMFIAFGLVPIGQGVYRSFFSWDGIDPAKWVGLGNYREFFSDPLVGQSFEHVGILVIFYCLLPVALGLLIAGVVARGNVRGLIGYRAALFLPYVLSSTVTAVIWEWLLSSNGVVNQLLGDVGLSKLEQPWLGSYTLALPAVGLIGAWVTFGLPMVMFIAGVQKIPTTLYEAARIDGAGLIREFRVVTLPGLRSEIAVALTLTLVGALRSFDLIFLLTGGGPGNTTTVPAYELYQNAFLSNQVGYASAIAVILTIIVAAVALVCARIGGVVWS